MKNRFFIILLFSASFLLFGSNIFAADNLPPRVRVLDAGNFTEMSEFLAYNEEFRGGVHLAVGDIDGDGIGEIIIGAGPGGSPHVRIFNENGEYSGYDFFPFHPDYRGGVSVAAGDVDGDNVDELIFGQAALGESRVKIYELNGEVRTEFLAYAQGLECGVNLAAADINNDGRDEIITGAGRKGGPHVRIFYGNGNPAPINLFPFHPDYRGGVSVAIGDVDGRQGKEIIASQAAEGEAWIKIYRLSGEVIANERVYPPHIKSGINVNVADINNDGVDEIITSANYGGGPEVRYFKYENHSIEYINKRIMAFDESSRFGVSAAIGNLDGDDQKEIVLGTGKPKPLPGWDVTLDVPLFRQERSLSCEAASLRMALVYKGINISEEDLINLIGFDRTPKRGAVWGDPQYGFVGSITGRQISSGYGVYWEPVQRVAAMLRPSYFFTGFDLKRMLEEVADGNPVIVWGARDNNYYPIYWNTEFGKLIYALIGEHARVVKGFIGNIANPSHIITNDPAYGEQIYETSHFLENWGYFNNSGVVVR